MWKKSDQPSDITSSSNEMVNPSPTIREAPPQSTRIDMDRVSGGANAQATKPDNQPTVISRGSEINGEITGGSDIQIAGNMKGSINVPNNIVTIERSGSAQATITAKDIIVYGNSVGNLNSKETVHVLVSGVVDGDIRAQNVILDKGCTFNGSIEMLKANAKMGQTAAKQDSSSGKGVANQKREAPRPVAKPTQRPSQPQFSQKGIASE